LLNSVAIFDFDHCH
jgi:hypothetical protein